MILKSARELMIERAKALGIDTGEEEKEEKKKPKVRGSRKGKVGKEAGRGSLLATGNTNIFIHLDSIDSLYITIDDDRTTIDEHLSQ